MSILKIKDLVHKYVTYGDTEEDKQEIAAIDHIDINVEKGEFVAILGKNGSEIIACEAHQWTFDADRRHSIYQRNGYKR